MGVAVRKLSASMPSSRSGFKLNSEKSIGKSAAKVLKFRVDSARLLGFVRFLQKRAAQADFTCAAHPIN
jgi:hypothetical protein